MIIQTSMVTLTSAITLTPIRIFETVTITQTEILTFSCPNPTISTLPTSIRQNKNDSKFK